MSRIHFCAIGDRLKFPKNTLTMHMVKKILVYLMLAGILGSGVAACWQWRQMSSGAADGGSPVIFRVEKGQGLKEIAAGLEREGLVKSDLFFRAYVFFKGLSGSLQAGDYSFTASMSFSDIVEKLRVGDTVKVRVTVFEGFNLKQVEASLNDGFGNVLACKKECGKKMDLSDYRVGDFNDKFAFFGGTPADASLEGFLYPDTYKFLLEDGRDGVVRKILRNFEAKLNSGLVEEIKNQGRSVYEVVTIASLIEKEVRGAADKRKVSGVIRNRLESGMPLQIDATLAYITGKTRFSASDTKIDSPYNTYFYKGLPKGPICNPGIESIMAAIYPEKSDYFFYLSARDGHTVFSKTFQQHLVAKRTYLK
jgi:UPF0755 protein